MEEIKRAVRRGNILAESAPEEDGAGRYLGNGRFGAVIGSTGLNFSRSRPQGGGPSQYMHRKHWGRFPFFSEAEKADTTADYIVPMFRVSWEQEERICGPCRRRQDFYDGTAETEFEFTASRGRERARVLCWFDMAEKNVAGIRIELSGGEMPVRIAALTEFIPYPLLWKRSVSQKVFLGSRGESWYMRLACPGTQNALASTVYFRTSAETELCEDGLCVHAGKGVTEICISYGEPAGDGELDASLERSAGRWHELWEEYGWFDFSDEDGQRMWVRSMAYLLSTFEDGPGPVQPTNGLTGNIFPFNFVQDMEYVCPALLLTGHLDIVKRWVEKFAGMIGPMRRYAARLWPEAKGIYPPWELPWGETDGYHEPHVPIVYCYEPHNAAYLCRMAAEAAEYAEDPEWTARTVHPLISELCLFYRSFCRKEQDGHWHFELLPCVGQDEAGGRNRKDYLCVLYGAKYCFQKAVEYGLDTDGSYARILADGFPFGALMSEEGIYHTSPGAEDFGRQKHPVQLNGLAYFPAESGPLPWEERAYRMRYELTSRAKEPYFFGWTLGEFLLAGSNMGDREGWKRDWDMIRKSDYTDQDGVQLYESSRSPEKSFYVTTHGLVAQSQIRNYVNDYWGRLQIGACPVCDGPVRFGNIVSRLGVRVSGSVEEGRVRAELTAWKDCVFVLEKETVRMKKGETLLCRSAGRGLPLTLTRPGGAGDGEE